MSTAKESAMLLALTVFVHTEDGIQKMPARFRRGRKPTLCTYCGTNGEHVCALTLARDAIKRNDEK